MRVFAKTKKIHRHGNHYYFGDYGEIPVAISLVEAKNDHDLGSEVKHASKHGHHFFIVLQGALELEIEDTLQEVWPDEVLMVEPGELHRFTRLIKAPCTFLVFETVKDPTGSDKVVAKGNA